MRKTALLLSLALALTGCSQNQPTPQKSEDITIAFGGDVHGVDQISNYLSNGGDPFKSISNTLKSADISVVNLESAVTTLKDHQDKEFVFNSNPYLLDWMKTDGIDVVNVGNNHAGDFLREGFIETYKNLKDRGFQIIGGGESGRDAWTAKVVNVRGTKIAFLGIAKINSGPVSVASGEYAGTTNGWDPTVIELAIKAAARKADAVIVYTHWGVESTNCPTKHEVTDANLWLEWGATAVIGSHPHRQQPVVFKNGKVIDYSLGNLVFHTSSEGGVQSGLGILKLSKEGSVISYKFRPALINGLNGTPSFLKGSAKTAAIKAKNSYCKSLGN